MTLLDLLPSIGRAFPRRFDSAIWPVTASADEAGRLRVGGVALADIADEFGTPSFVIDEADFRHRVHRYRKALRETEVIYAGKSLLTTAVASWLRDERLGVSVGSSGELAVALAGGIDPVRVILQGRAKPSDELRDAVTAGVGRIVVDSDIEIAHLAGLARRRQCVLIRVTPDIDSRGFRVSDRAAAVAQQVLAHPILDLIGLHCHIGSQVNNPALYGEAIRRMITVMAELRRRHGVILTELNIGGGHAVPSAQGDQELDLDDLASEIEDALDEACATHRFPRPVIVLEPGRGISARAGVTLYRVCSVDTRPGGRTTVVIDGGMNDNSPCAATRNGRYTVALVNRHSLAVRQLVTVAGRRGETGHELARDVGLPSDLHPGDLLAVACTGAYHHSMASNYNLLGRPPLVGVRGGRVQQLVRRETVADVLRRDCFYRGMERHG